MVRKVAMESAMANSFATAQRPVDNASGEKAMSRLADRIASMAPPPLNLTAAQVAPCCGRRLRWRGRSAPAPRFNSKADQAEKFDPPRDPAVTSSTPPPAGYTPPAALQHGD